MNHFEKLIKEKAQKVLFPSEDPLIWESIETALKKPNRFRNFAPAMIAATILILLSTGIFLVYTISNSNNRYVKDISVNPPEIQLLENDFIAAIDKQLGMLKQESIPHILKSNFKVLIDEFYNLDKSYPKVEETNGSLYYSRNLENLIVEHYSRKQKILDRIEQEIQKINRLENENSNEYEKILLPI